jgi:hypothetical protein
MQPAVAHCRLRQPPFAAFQSSNVRHARFIFCKAALLQLSTTIDFQLRCHRFRRAAVNVSTAAFRGLQFSKPARHDCNLRIQMQMQSKTTRNMQCT